MLKTYFKCVYSLYKYLFSAYSDPSSTQLQLFQPRIRAAVCHGPPLLSGLLYPSLIFAFSLRSPHALLKHHCLQVLLGKVWLVFYNADLNQFYLSRGFCILTCVMKTLSKNLELLFANVEGTGEAECPLLVPLKWSQTYPSCFHGVHGPSYSVRLLLLLPKLPVFSLSVQLYPQSTSSLKMDFFLPTSISFCEFPH